MYEMILKKRNGGVLSEEEIRQIIREYTDGNIPDYQMSALLMAIYFRGLNPEETVALTKAMADSGSRMDLSSISGIKVDKHSSGGVGDKTSLILGPMLASLGIPVAKMSGRGLGHTGGTIDKLESIPGFSTNISMEQFLRQVETVKLAIAAQTVNLAPADKKLYALRDVTGTVDQMGLIASSIMSKKLAGGADAICLDVKCGSGAFMQTKEDAEELAKTMVRIGTMAGRETEALITDMNEPLGTMVGNAMEICEVVEALQGRGEQRLMEVVMALASRMVLLAGKADTEEKARRMLAESIQSGKAMEAFVRFVEAQGGDPEAVLHPERLPRAEIVREVSVEKGGYLASCDNAKIGLACVTLGGGRLTKESTIDPGVGIEILKHLGDRITSGEAVARIYGRDEETVEKAAKTIREAYRCSDEKPEINPVISLLITKETVKEA